jgi:RNA polymerase sigma-70 factor (ECF subfamily)
MVPVFCTCVDAGVGEYRGGCLADGGRSVKNAAAGAPGDADAVLVRRVQDGDVEAFGRLVARHQDRVYRVALRLLGNPADAQDAAQEALVRAWQGLSRFRGQSAFSTWLYRIVTNTALNHVRGRPADLPLPEGMPAGAVHLPEQVVERKGRRSALTRAIASLPVEQRAPLVLHELEGFSYEEVGRILGTSVPSVKGRIFRARRTLQVTLVEWK